MVKQWLRVILLGSILWSVAGTSQAATIGFDFTLSGNQAWTGRLGNFFNVGATPIQITALGVFDSPPAGLVGSIQVGLFDVGANSLLLATTVGPGTPGTLVNNTRFVNIAPLVLTAGSYAVVAVGFSANDPNYNTNIAPGYAGVTIDTGGGLISIPAQSGLYDAQTSLGTNLTGVTTGAWTFGGGSFQFQAVSIPEPTTALLLGIGIVGLARRLRRTR